jgi:CheY-like chemotaxis protein
VRSAAGGRSLKKTVLDCIGIQTLRSLSMTKVAVVDDNSDNRLIIRTILEDQYEIIEYASGIEAIEGFRKERPDIVILDISLPEMDGTEILRRIRSDRELQSLPVVALTAHAMVGDREKYLAAGFNDYVAKPILDMNVLFSTIQKWLPSTTS